jgi:uncharacterized membrane protein YbhN (UPF0104 family)
MYKVNKGNKAPRRLSGAHLTRSVLFKLLLSILWVAALVGIGYMWIKDRERFQTLHSGWTLM